MQQQKARARPSGAPPKWGWSAWVADVCGSKWQGTRVERLAGTGVCLAGTPGKWEVEAATLVCRLGPIRTCL